MTGNRCPYDVWSYIRLSPWILTFLWFGSDGSIKDARKTIWIHVIVHSPKEINEWKSYTIREKQIGLRQFLKWKALKLFCTKFIWCFFFFISFYTKINQCYSIKYIKLLSSWNSLYYVTLFWIMKKLCIQFSSFT